jgi:hypothetical protein
LFRPRAFTRYKSSSYLSKYFYYRKS